MRGFIVSLLFSTLTSVLFAQETAIAVVHYSFKHVNDTNFRDRPLQDEVVTYLAPQSSYYTTYTDERIKGDILAQKQAKDYQGHLSVGFSGTPVKNFYIISSRQKKMVELCAIASSFDIYKKELAYDVPDWKIEDDVMEIGGYSCQKAITRFKGRNYVAWFTSEIPLPFGPWKLHGLPGLILSVEDDLQEVSFSYLGFDKLDETTMRKIEIPYYTIEATQKEIDRLKAVFNENPSHYYGLLNSSGRMAIANDFYGIDYSKNTIDIKSKDDYKPSFKTNNPLEKNE